jgi:hypothetical protein
MANGAGFIQLGRGIPHRFTTVGTHGTADKCSGLVFHDRTPVPYRREHHGLSATNAWAKVDVSDARGYAQ